MTRTSTRLLAASGAVVLTALAAAPASAAAVVSRADANALTVSIAGNGQGTGTAGATYDGQETRTGETRPSPSPFSQDFVDLGVLTQQATAGDGFSAACAGVAGAGGGIVQIGDGSCLTPGNTVSGSLSDIGLDAIGLTAPEELPTDQIPEQLRTVFEQALALVPQGSDELDAIIAEAVAAVDSQIGPLGLTARFDAIEGRCRVEDGSPSGSASITNAKLVLSGGGQQVVLVDLPANPAPNTEVVTDLSAVVDRLLGALTTQLTNGLNGAGAELATAIQPVREQLVAGIRDDVEGQLAPLEDNVLRVTLNEQSRPTADSIRVTALHARVLPAAADAVGASLADVQVGNANCGPADRVPAEAAPAATPEKAVPQLPTAVSAGVEGKPATTTLSTRLAEAAPLTGIALAGLLIALAGVLGVRRHLG